MVKSLNHDRLLQVVRYDPVTGIFTRKEHTNSCRAGTVLGSDSGRGYLRISIDCQHYYAHRLAWFYIYREWPKFIDHVNGDRADNRIFNLRVATRAENNANKKTRSDNTSGVRGVVWHKQISKWVAQIQKNGHNHYLGAFLSKEAAARAYDAMAISLFGNFANPNGATNGGPNNEIRLQQLSFADRLELRNQ